MPPPWNQTNRDDGPFTFSVPSFVTVTIARYIWLPLSYVQPRLIVTSRAVLAKAAAGRRTTVWPAEALLTRTLGMSPTARYVLAAPERASPNWSTVPVMPSAV